MSDWVVSKASEDDKEWVLKQCEAFLRTADVNVPFNKAHLLVLWNTPQIQVLVVKHKGIRKGLGVYSTTGHPFNPDVSTFTELVWWVPEEHRNSRAGLILLDVMDTIATKHDLALFSVLHNSPVAERALTKRGYKHKETAFVKVR